MEWITCTSPGAKKSRHYSAYSTSAGRCMHMLMRLSNCTGRLEIRARRDRTVAHSGSGALDITVKGSINELVGASHIHAEILSGQEGQVGTHILGMRLQHCEGRLQIMVSYMPMYGTKLSISSHHKIPC